MMILNTAQKSKILELPVTTMGSGGIDLLQFQTAVIVANLYCCTNLSKFFFFLDYKKCTFL